MFMMHNLTIKYNVQRTDHVNQAMICPTKKIQNMLNSKSCLNTKVSLTGKVDKTCYSQSLEMCIKSTLFGFAVN